MRCPVRHSGPIRVGRSDGVGSGCRTGPGKSAPHGRSSADYRARRTSKICLYTSIDDSQSGRNRARVESGRLTRSDGSRGRRSSGRPGPSDRNGHRRPERHRGPGPDRTGSVPRPRPWPDSQPRKGFAGVVRQQDLESASGRSGPAERGGCTGSRPRSMRESPVTGSGSSPRGTR